METRLNNSDGISQEYDDYTPKNPDLIPSDLENASNRVESMIAAGIEKCSKEEFLKGWWALHWLNPGLHPDDYDDWEDLVWRAMAYEAFRRAAASELEDEELYAAEATHNRVWVEMTAAKRRDQARPGKDRIRP